MDDEEERGGVVTRTRDFRRENKNSNTLTHLFNEELIGSNEKFLHKTWRTVSRTVFSPAYGSEETFFLLTNTKNIFFFFGFKEKRMPFLSPDQKARLEFVFKYYDTEMKGLLPIRRLGTVR